MRCDHGGRLLPSLAGELPRVDAAVFADRLEPAAVYQHLARKESAATQAGGPAYR